MKTGTVQPVAVTTEQHQVFTNAWRKAIPYVSGTRSATRAQIYDAAREIYAAYPEILKKSGLR
jgi:hypothetical protein